MKKVWPSFLRCGPSDWLAPLHLSSFMVNPSSMAWSSLPLPDSLRWAGVSVGIAGGALLLWTFFTLGPDLTDTVVVPKNPHARDSRSLQLGPVIPSTN